MIEKADIREFDPTEYIGSYTFDSFATTNLNYKVESFDSEIHETLKK